MRETKHIQIFQFADGQVQLVVSLNHDTVWLSQAQMTELFGRERSVITKNINNIFKEAELREISNVQKMHIATSNTLVSFASQRGIVRTNIKTKREAFI